MSTAPFESLCYLIKLTNSQGDDFFEFFKNGKKVNGQYEPDGQGRLKIGVINWLVGTEQCLNVHFFTTTVPIPAIVVTLPNRNLPWFDIGGFMDFVVSGSATLPLGTGQFQLAQRTDLEDLLTARCAVLAQVPTARVKDFKAALRGEKGTDLAAILKELGLTLPMI